MLPGSVGSKRKCLAKAPVQTRPRETCSSGASVPDATR
jgi:hypothetical protein